MGENIKIALMGLTGIAIGSFFTYFASSKSVDSQEKISKIQIHTQKEIEENKLVFEREKIFIEYIIKNAKTFNSSEQESIIRIIKANNPNRLMLEMVYFIVQSNPNIKQREQINLALVRSINKNIALDQSSNSIVNKGIKDIAKTNLTELNNPKVIQNVLADILEAYSIPPNKCFDPIAVYSKKQTSMYRDADMQNEIREVLPNTKVILFESNEKSFSGKLDGKDGYFRMDDFRKIF